MNEKQKAVQISGEDARILLDFISKLEAQDMIDVYGRNAPMRTIMKALQAVENLRGAIVAAMQE